MTEHTSGPWICHSGMVWKLYKGVEIPIARMDREIGNGTTPCERDANAHLIAAAPDLLYVAMRVVQDWDHSQNRARGTDLLKQARAFIAKANGLGRLDR